MLQERFDFEENKIKVCKIMGAILKLGLVFYRDTLFVGGPQNENKLENFSSAESR